MCVYARVCVCMCVYVYLCVCLHAIKSFLEHEYKQSNKSCCFFVFNDAAIYMVDEPKELLLKKS